MDIKIKREKTSGAFNITSVPLPTQQTQDSEPNPSNSTTTAHMKLTLDSPNKRSERDRDVSSNGQSSPTDKPVVDLRRVKVEKFDNDDTQANANKERCYIAGKESLLAQNSIQDPNLKSRKSDALLLGKQSLQDSSGNTASDESGSLKPRRFSDDTAESFPYRVPIVYPIQSPPIDYPSIPKDNHPPNPKDYRLERDRSRSPMEHQRLYEEPSSWSMETPLRGSEGRYDDNNSSSNVQLSSRVSPGQKNSPYTGSPHSESKDDSTSSQAPAPSNSTSSNPNAERSATTKRSRYKNIEIMIPAETGDREEESLWKQVQRYRYRKRLPLGKLAPTQEETIFMQYNEIRERRHREGRVTSRNVKPLHNMPAKEPSHSPSNTNPDNDAKSDTDPKLQGSDQTVMGSPPRSPEQDGDEPILEPIPSYVNRGRPRMPPDVAKSNGIKYVYVTGPSHESRRSSLPSNSSNPELHPAMFDGNNECETNRSREHIENQPIKVSHGYHGYMSPDPHRCHSHESRGVEMRGRPVARSGASECRGYLPYEDHYHDNPPYPNHRSFYPPPRFHASDSCYDNRKRRMHSCGHHCCRRKKMRTSSDDDDDYGVDNEDVNSRWQRSETRDNEEARCHETQNGSRQGSPASLDSRDNESVENGTTQRLHLEDDIHPYENGRTSKEGSPGLREGEADDVMNSHSSSLSLDDARREHDDDDVICQVNGLFSLPGYRETKYDITKGELQRRTGLPETLTRVEMISYVRQAKTSGRMLLDTNGITTSNRSHPTILSRVCEREAQVLASGIHKMNLEYLPLKKLAQTCMDMYKSRGCDGCQDCRMKLRRRLVDVEITRSMLKEFLHVVQEASAEGTLECYELASHTFGSLNIVNHLKLIDEYYKLLLLALDKE